MQESSGWSVKRIARLGGFLSPFSGVPDGFSVSVLRKVFVPNNAAATAANVLAHESLVRYGIVAELAAMAIFAVSIVLLYEVFKPASRRAARLFLVITLMGTLIQALDILGDVAALMALKGGAGVAGLGAPQAQAVAYACLRMHSYVYTVALFYIGAGALCLAYLARHSTFLPRVLGSLMVIDALGFMTGSVCSFVAPALAAALLPFVPFGTAAVGEGPLWVWLMAKSVHEERWQEQSRRARAVA